MALVVLQRQHFRGGGELLLIIGPDAHLLVPAGCCDEGELVLLILSDIDRSSHLTEVDILHDSEQLSITEVPHLNTPISRARDNASLRLIEAGGSDFLFIMGFSELRHELALLCVPDEHIGAVITSDDRVELLIEEGDADGELVGGGYGLLRFELKREPPVLPARC